MGAADALAERVVAAGRRCPLAKSVLAEWARSGTPRQVEHLAGHLEAECASRDASKRANLLGRRALPQAKTLEDHEWGQMAWPEGFGRDDLPSLSLLDAREDLVPVGDVGTGKTHMAEALCAPCRQDARPARLLAASSLVARPRRARDDARPGRELAQIGRAEPLVTGGLGLLPPGAEGARLPFQVISQAHERQPIVLTTNPGSSRWGTVFADDKLAAAIVNRVARHGRLPEFEGESYRVRRALMQ